MRSGSIPTGGELAGLLVVYQLLTTISSLKQVISNQSVEVVKSQPYLDYFQNSHSKMETNLIQIINVHTKWIPNFLMPILSSLVKY